uniref:Centromere protein N-like isoform X2 n=1 Tax=Crassostrea virginica TaxID=6565 RepID=A0A8B8EDG5_CRAVI|nr:centromere protein N-like isoform X2 [Crassostrea virginica]
MGCFSDVLRSAFTKCKASELEHLLKQWGYLTEDELLQLNFSKSKMCVFRDVLSLCQEKNRKRETADRIDQFDLHCTKESWQSDPEKFKKKLQQQVDLYFDSTASVSVTLQDGALWCRLYIPTGNHNMNSNTVYLIYYPHCQCFAISAFKVSVQNFLFQCLSNAFGYATLTSMNLSGLHYKSLFQLAFNKLGETSFGLTKDVQSLPFMGENRRKRKAEEIEMEPNMRSEDIAMKRKRSLSLETAFGNFEQPVLESLQFKVEVKFMGRKNLKNFSEDGEPIRCCVKFEGPSVLEGVRNLASCGLANEPLPKHLLKVNSLGTNNFVLKSKDKS